MVLIFSILLNLYSSHLDLPLWNDRRSDVLVLGDAVVDCCIGLGLVVAMLVVPMLVVALVVPMLVIAVGLLEDDCVIVVVRWRVK